ncbi:MAG TPA: hypothetical protein VEJ18_03835 [Planctomycetota bacterium]|nr:hypothetical protein [Planctomycetota bacterium]
MLTLLACALLAQEAPPAVEKWLYYQTNLQVEANAAQAEEIWRRAAKAGYTTVLLADSKNAKLADVPKAYARHAEKVKAVARELNLKIVPAVFHIGYSNSMLWHDPNLAEGLPVRDQLFVVKAGVARVEPDPAVALKPKWGFIDDTFDASFKAVDPKGKNARFSQRLKVRPFRQYHVSVRVRTQDWRGGETKVAALGKTGELNHAYLGVKPTQDWTEHHVTFNSLENEEIGLYFGTWSGETGTIEWADPRIEECGLVNLIRRPGAPFEVKTEDGRTLEEGKDFEPVADPLMGSKPYNGVYTSWHEPPTIRTSLPDGTRLRVSYYHATVVHDHQVVACLSEPKVVELLKDEAKRVHALWGAKGYMMSHDEIRTGNWCKACRDRGLDAGALLADNARTCVKILKELNPGGEIYVWNDMFDPHHNARNNYYLVRGDLKGSWEGLDPDVRIVAWYYGKRKESLEFFTGRGHSVVMAGYYDGDPVANARGWMEAAKAHRGKVLGLMYTTWQRDYKDLETFAEAADAARN